MAPFKSSEGRNLGKPVRSYLSRNIGGTIVGGGKASASGRAVSTQEI